MKAVGPGLEACAPNRVKKHLFYLPDATAAGKFATFPCALFGTSTHTPPPWRRAPTLRGRLPLVVDRATASAPPDAPHHGIAPSRAGGAHIGGEGETVKPPPRIHQNTTTACR